MICAVYKYSFIHSIRLTKHLSFFFETYAHVDKTVSGKPTSRKPTTLWVDCGATAHIITDTSRFMKFDDTFNPDKHVTEFANGTWANNVALKRDVDITIADSTGTPVKATLQNVLFIPSYPQDIFSVQAAMREVPVWLSSHILLSWHTRMAQSLSLRSMADCIISTHMIRTTTLIP